MKKIRIGTRGSLLALTQANIVKDEILKYNSDIYSDSIEIDAIVTDGDRTQADNTDLSKVGGKGLFIREIEVALLNKKIDLAVHSMKDMPALISDDLEFICYLKREDPRDAFLSMKYTSIDNLPTGSIIGTSSVRRRAQILHIKKDLSIVPFRGNVTTRIEKLSSKIVDATFLAMAGINRLHIDNHLYMPIDIDVMLPAPAQGVIGIEVNKGDNYIKNILRNVNCKKTEILIKAERAFVRALAADCNNSIAALANINCNMITLKSEILSINGDKSLKSTISSDISDAEKIGYLSAEELLNKGGYEILNNLSCLIC